MVSLHLRNGTIERLNQRIFKPFGCIAYAFNTSPDRKKLDSRAIKCRFMGHKGNSLFRLWDIRNNKPIRSAHIVFDEKAKLADTQGEIALDTEELDDSDIQSLLSLPPPENNIQIPNQPAAQALEGVSSEHTAPEGVSSGHNTLERASTGNNVQEEAHHNYGINEGVPIIT